MLIWLLHIFHLFCICTLVFASSTVVADEEDHVPSIASTSGMPSSLVNGSVCAITGEYVESELDMVLPGPEPLILRRIYSSNNDTCAHFYDAWQLAHPSSLTIDRTRQMQDGHERKRYLAHLLEPSGSELLYHGKIEHKGLNKQEFLPPKGLTNCAAGEISARTNLRNQTFFILNTRNYARVDEPNGTTRHFTKFQKEGVGDLVERHYHQYMTSKPNGHELRYCYDEEDGRLISMGAHRKNHKSKYSIFKFDYEPITEGAYHSGIRVNVTASDKRQVIYEFQRIPLKKDNRYYLVQAIPSDGPKTTYCYSYKSLSPHMHVGMKEHPEGRYLETTYYTPGNNNLSNVLQIDCSANDPRIDRVSMQRAPVGHDQTPITTHLYHYCLNPGKDSGYTDVYDAQRHLTRFHYDDDQHLTCIERFTGKWPNPFQAYSKEHYIWRDNNLIGTFLQDHSGRFLNYDDCGNIANETFYGKLTSAETPPLIVHEGYPVQNGCETYNKYYTYQSNRRHLPLTETEDNGKTVQYDYKPGTDLVSARLLSQGSAIKLRQFYEHNEDGIVTKVVTDNGSSKILSDLTGVTEQHITRIQPREKMPIGLPEWVEEFYLDLKTHKEVLIKQTWSEYSPEGRLIKQIHYDSQENERYTLTWKYDTHGNVIQETNALGQIITRKYDANDNLIEQQGPGITTSRYAYDYSNRLISQVDEDAHDRSTIQHRYDYLGNRIATIDRYNNTTEYVYDEFNRLIATTTPDHATTSIAYDIANNPIQVTDPLGRITKTTYNARGKPTAIFYPDGTVQRLEYYRDGTLHKTIAPNGTVTTYAYDVMGHVISEEVCADGQISRKTSTYDAFHLLSTTDAEGLTTTYSYDGAGRLTCVASGNHLTTYVYDPLGRVAKMVSGGIIKLYEYDLLDRVIQEREQNHSGEILLSTEYAYDADGNRSQVIKHTQQGASYTTIEFNGHHQPIALTDALGNTTHVVYNHNHSYNGQLMLRKETTDPCGNTTYETYDSMRRIVESTSRNAVGVLLAQTQFAYDHLGNLTQRTDEAIVNGQPIRQSLSTWEYNSVNKVISQREGVGTHEQRETQYRYNACGQKEAQIKPDGTQLLFTYDGHGRLRTYTASDNSFSYAYTYNRNHLPVQIHDAVQNCSTTRNYDPYGNMTKETLNNGLELAYEYDLSNRLQHMVLPDKSHVRYHFDGSRLTQVMRLSPEQKILYAHQYHEYDLAGNPSSMILPFNSDRVKVHYDLLSRPTSIASKQRSDTLQYDAVGNLRHYEIADPLAKISSDYTYDDLYQLTSETGFEAHAYAYDSLNNRIMKDSHQHTHNALNQLLQQQDTTYRYDHNGNRVQKNTVQYRYDALDRLIEVVDGDNHTSYTYDSFNRRMTKTNQGSTWKYIYQNSNEIGAYVNGQLTELRILGAGLGAEIGAAVALELSQQVYIPRHDHNGNVTTLLDVSGNPVETYRYTAFGEETILDTTGNEISSINPWRFSSKRIDPETQFVYFGNRYYDPGIGRWVTADPLGFADGPNLYAYLRNSPLIHIDPYGLEAGDAYRASVQAALDSPRISKQLRDDRKKKKTVDRYDQQARKQNETSTDSCYSVAWESFCRGDNNPMNDYTDKPWRRPSDHTPFDDATNLDYSSGHEVIAIAASVGALFAWEYVGLRGSQYLVSTARIHLKNLARKYVVKQTKNKILRLEDKSEKFDWRFPENPNNFLKNLARDSEGHIYVAQNLRIRPEIHVLKPGAKYCPRHHSQHYHVETRINPKDGWIDKENVIIVKPPGYQKGAGTGFLPGEYFPGIQR